MADRSVAATNQWRGRGARGSDAFVATIRAHPDFAGFWTVADDGDPDAVLVTHPDFPDFLTIDVPDLSVDGFLGAHPDYVDFVTPLALDPGPATAVLVADPSFAGFVAPSDDLAQPAAAALYDDPDNAGFVTPSHEPDVNSEGDGFFLIIGGGFAVPMSN